MLIYQSKANLDEKILFGKSHIMKTQKLEKRLYIKDHKDHEKDHKRS